jgi:hypothetical protein
MTKVANESSSIVQRVWNYCNVLRDDGMSYQANRYSRYSRLGGAPRAMTISPIADSANLPAPEVLALEISENLEAALEQFNSIYESLAKP